MRTRTQLRADLTQNANTHFIRASTPVRPEQLTMPHGSDPQPYLDAVDGYAKAGYDTQHAAAVGRTTRS